MTLPLKDDPYNYVKNARNAGNDSLEKNQPDMNQAQNSNPQAPNQKKKNKLRRIMSFVAQKIKIF